jgi:uncharacterized protein
VNTQPPRLPAAHVEETRGGGRTIAGVATSVAAFVDRFRQGPRDAAIRVSSFADFERDFGGLDETSEASYAVQQFFLNGGAEAWIVRVEAEPLTEAALLGVRANKTGIYALEDVSFNILCIPAAANLSPGAMRTVYAEAEAYCEERRAFLIVDVPAATSDPDAMRTWLSDNAPLRHRNAAVYFPRVQIPDPLHEGRLRRVGPSGTLAGLYARTDAARGVWKAPAGAQARLHAVQALDHALTDRESSDLDLLGANGLRTFPTSGPVAWGARTLVGGDAHSSEWRYVPVRRLALVLEESLLRGTRWAAFEPNDEPLWSQIRLSIDDFMQGLFRQGAFQGQTQRQAYFVKCDRETTTQEDIDRGVLNIVVGFAPLRPAEFVIVSLQQLAGRIPP